ncbi:MAG: VWA domain-containing protein [Pseudomonadales bacterium]|nr:VWA domain-containing protein [Pseudomonadales bacterium]
METPLVEFFKALRGAGVNVSTAEAIEATQAAQILGYSDRNQLKSGLGLVLAKSLEDKSRFDQCFDQFFQFSKLDNLSEHQSQQELDQQGASAEDDPPPSLTERLQQLFNLPGGSSGPGGSGQPSMTQPQSPLGQLLLEGDNNALALAMAEAGREARVNEIQWMTQKGLYGRRMMQAMGLGELEQEMWTAEASDDSTQQQLGNALRTARDRLRADVKGFVEQQFVLQAAATGKKLREETMMSVRIEHLREFKDVKNLVQKMAKKLIATHSRRKKVLNRGMLDMRNTLRQSVPTGGIPFDVYWKKKRKDRPRIMALCDVSGSVSQVSRFLLMFLFSLNEVLPKVRAFAFSSNLGEVTDAFNELSVDEAIDYALDTYGKGSTDYGQSLADFTDLCMNDIDNRTTVIILGDGRNNYGDDRAELLKQIHLRSKKVIWLNPEAPMRWGTGDSEMLKYKAYCSNVAECNSLRQLERFIDRLLTHQ